MECFWDGVDPKTGKRTGGYGSMPCFMCNGTGEVDEGFEARLALGENRRQDRIARGLSLRQEAARLGITAEELCDREHGRK
jgi:hypothetical protein